MIIIYSNCQGIGIKYFLSMSKLIYDDIVHMRVDELIKNNDIYNKKVLANASVFIYQNIDQRHNTLSTDYLLTLLPKECIRISFPYIYNNSFYPTKGPLKLTDDLLKKDCHVIYDNSKVITDLLDNGITLDDIYNRYDAGKVDFKYSERWDITTNILKERELNCDIKVGDFIIGNFKKEKLFLLENHPTSAVFIFAVNQILDILQIPHLNIDNYGNNDADLPGGSLPIDISSNDYFNFEYNIKLDNIYYKKIISNIYMVHKITSRLSCEEQLT